MRFPCLIIIAALAPLATALLTHTAGHGFLTGVTTRPSTQEYLLTLLTASQTTSQKASEAQALRSTGAVTDQTNRYASDTPPAPNACYRAVLVILPTNYPVAIWEPSEPPHREGPNLSHEWRGALDGLAHNFLRGVEAGVSEAER